MARALGPSVQTAVTAMVVTADDFTSLLGSLNELMDRQFVMRVLQSVPALGKEVFNKRVLQMLVDSMTQLNVSPGAEIVKQVSAACV